jgi:hypothetical protein
MGKPFEVRREAALDATPEQVGNAVTSRDGTSIGYSVTGDGPALILVDGAMCYRGSGPAASFAAALSDRFTVYTYDRRGRGESGDTAPYAPEREVDDLRALTEAAGGARFMQSLTAANLVDEYRILIHPTVLGTGLNLFGSYRDLRLVDSTRFAGGTVALVYRRA